MELVAEHAGFAWSVLVTIHIVVFTIVILFEKRTPSATLAWILAVIFFPYVGIALYLLIGRRALRRNEQRNAIARDVVAEIPEIASEPPQFDLAEAGLENNHAQLIHLTEKMTGHGVTGGNTVRVYFDGEAKHQALLDAIQHAEKYVFLHYYILRDDKTGKEVIAALADAARRGVVIRLLVDGVGSISLSHSALNPLVAAGAEADAAARRNGSNHHHLNNHLNNHPLGESELSTVQIEWFFPPRFIVSTADAWLDRLNYRNHRKIVVIDGKTGLTGGFNIGDEYRGLDPAFGHWRDTHVVIRGPAVLELLRIFITDWVNATGRGIRRSLFTRTPARIEREHRARSLVAAAQLVQNHPNDHPQSTATQHTQSNQHTHHHATRFDGASGDAVQVIASGPESRWHPIHKLYFRAIADASRRVWVTTPYFVPDDAVLVALITSALAGVDVRLLMPRNADHPLVRAAARSYYAELLEAGVRIFEYTRGFIHAKTLIVDDSVASIGSANVDIRSFQLNYEVNLFFYGHGVTTQLAAQFLIDQRDAVEITLDTFEQRPSLEKLGEKVTRLLSPVL